MRGVITIQVRKRRVTDSKSFKDKWRHLDTVQFRTSEKGIYKTLSKETGRTYFISKDELAFVRFIFQNYGPGDYNMMLFGKGNNRGFRRFWDGIITEDMKFIRRREQSHYNETSIFERKAGEKTINIETFIGRYMKVKRSGVWYRL